MYFIKKKVKEWVTMYFMLGLNKTMMMCFPNG